MSTALLNQLREATLARVCRPFQPNQAKLLKHAQQLNLRSSAQDQKRILRLHVDEQPDFIWPFTYMTEEGVLRYVLFEGTGDSFPVHVVENADWISSPSQLDPSIYDSVWAGRLSVGGAVQDLQRTLNFDFDNMERITQHAFSVDSHGRQSVFDTHHYRARYATSFDGGVLTGTYQVDAGQHPYPFTILPPEAIYHPTLNSDGLWLPSGIVSAEEWTYRYARHLEDNQAQDLRGNPNNSRDRLPLMLWTIHCTQETFGGSIDPTIWQMALLHGYARQVDPILYYKGQSWATEHYGIFQPEVPIEGDRYAGVNYDALKLYEAFDLILVSGQAAGNCVRRSVEQNFYYILNHRQQDAHKMVLLSDTMSLIPGTEEGASRSFDAMRSLGLQVLTTTEATNALS